MYMFICRTLFTHCTGCNALHCARITALHCNALCENCVFSCAKHYSQQLQPGETSCKYPWIDLLSVQKIIPIQLHYCVSLGYCMDSHVCP